jgi:integrase/recombinase XerD
MRLFREGRLIPRKKTMTFGEFGEGWWDIKTCKYLQLRQLSDPLSDNTIDLNRDNTRNYLKGFFGPYQMGDISVETVKAWLLHMGARGLAKSTINGALKTLRTMLYEAVSRGIITENPAKSVKELKMEEAKRIILTLEEVDSLFPDNWEAVWKNEVIYRVHLIASCTGMRIAELRGLKGERVFEDHIQVCAQYNSRHGYKEKTKTKRDRIIPIAEEVWEFFEPLLNVNGEGYVFSEDGGVKPISYERINRAFGEALETIGISHEERMKRNLTIHAWRHFFNTLMRDEDIPDAKVQEVTGHLTKKETDHYTHFDARKFSEVRAVQAKLLNQGKGKPNTTGKAAKEKKQGTGKAVKAGPRPATGRTATGKPKGKRATV